MNTFKLARFKAKTNIEKNQRRTPRHYKTMRIGLVLAAMMFGGVFYGLATVHTPETEAIEPSSFNAGYLIDDSVFYNPNTMTVAEIQKLLDDKSPACDMWGTGLISGRKYPDGTWVPAGTTRAQYAKVMREKYGNTKYHDPPYVCINKYYENPETHQSLYETQGVATAGMKSAAQIIYDVAQKYSINPQVLLVMIKKESLVWGDNWPLKYEYNTVMGYGCPDNAPCNEAYYGFYNQVQKAAWQLKYYREHPTSYRYKSGQVNNIQYHPNTYCGTKQVYLENIATTSLYIYTPYTPNDAALRAYPGTGDDCSSYGNRNFYMFFREWFGSTYQEDRFISLVYPRYFKVNENVSRINPYTGLVSSESEIEKDSIVYFQSKIEVGDSWCYRTKHNTENKIVACVPEQYIEEAPFDYSETFSDPIYGIVDVGKSKIRIKDGNDITYTTEEQIQRSFKRQVTFLGNSYLMTDFDVDTIDDESRVSCFKTEDVFVLEGYEQINEWLIIKDDTWKYVFPSTDKHEEIQVGGLRRFLSKFIIDGVWYYQTEYDFNNTKAVIAIKESDLIRDTDFINLGASQRLTTTARVERKDYSAGVFFDYIEANTTLEFKSYKLIDGSLYYRTAHNTTYDLPYSIPYIFLK